MNRLLILISLGFLFGCRSHTADTSSDQTPPNILFIAIDDMNDWVGALGGHPQAHTPNIDRLASQGVLFTNAHTPAPACSPCRNALLYGRQPHKSGLYPFYDRPEMDPGFFAETPSLMQLMMNHGYQVFGAGKIHHGEMGTPTIEQLIPQEYTENINHKLIQLPDPVVDSTDGVGLKTFGKMCGRPSLSPLEEHIDYNISTYGQEVLQRKHDKPFFLALGFIKPHLPFVAPKKYFDLFPPENIQKPLIRDDDLADISWAGRSNAKLGDDFRYRSRDEWEGWIRAYLACNAYTDDNVGRVVDALDHSNYKDNTIIVLWSDHGYHFGEKRSHRKFSLWEESSRVPLIVLDPRNKSNGERCAAPVSLIDLFPTLLNKAGIPVPEYSDGQDLNDLLENPSATRDTPVLTTWGRGNYSLRSSRWRYTRYFDGSEELYDHDHDPQEWTNLSRDSEYADVISELKNYLPSTEAPLVLGGKALHNVVDADQPSLENFKKQWQKMQQNGMELE